MSERVFYCSACGEPNTEPFVVNGVQICADCYDDIPRRGADMSGYRQPPVRERREKRERWRELEN